MRGGSLLKNLAPTTKAAKRVRDPKFIHDDYVTPEDAELRFRETIPNQLEINSFSSLGKPRGMNYHANDANAKDMRNINNTTSAASAQDSKRFDSVSSQEQEDKNPEQSDFDSMSFPDFSKKEFLFQQPQVQQQSTTQNKQDPQQPSQQPPQPPNNPSRSKQTVIPPAPQGPPQKPKISPPSNQIVPPNGLQSYSTSNNIPKQSASFKFISNNNVNNNHNNTNNLGNDSNDDLSNDDKKSLNIKNNNKNKISGAKQKNIAQVPQMTPTDLLTTEQLDIFEYEDLLQKMSVPIQRRLVVNLPTDDFQARRLQVSAALDMIDRNVTEIAQNVNDTNAALIELSRKSRNISEKSMDLTQTTEAVVSKVNVMADWIDGLEKVGSGLKIQFIEWVVKFVSFLSSLLLLFYQTVKKANPARLWRKKTETAFKAKDEDGDEEEDD